MVELIIPAGTRWSKDNLKCPICGEKEVRHISNGLVRSGETEGWICQNINCRSTWRD